MAEENVEFNIIGEIDLSNVMSGLKQAQAALDSFSKTAGGTFKGGTINIKTQTSGAAAGGGMEKAFSQLSKLAVIAGGVYTLTRASSRLNSMFTGFTRLFLLLIKPVGDLLAAFLRPIYFLLKLFVREFNQIMRPLIQKVGKAMDQVGKLFEAGGFEAVFDYVQKIFQDAFSPENMRVAADFVIGGLKTIGDTIKSIDWGGIFTKIGDFIIALMPTAFAVLGGLGGIVLDIITATFEALPSILETAFNILGSMLSETLKTLPELFGKLTGEVVPAITEVFSNIATMIGEVDWAATFQQIADFILATLPSIIQGAFDILWSMGPVILSLVSAAFEVLPTLIIAALQGAMTFVTEAVAQLPNLLNYIMETIQTVLEGAGNAIAELLSPANIQKVTDMIVQAIEGISKFIEETDWVAVFTKIGTWLGDFIVQVAPAIINGALQILMALGPALFKLFWTILSHVPEMLLGLGSLIWNILERTIPLALNILGQLGSWLWGLITGALASIGTWIVNGLIDAMNFLISMMTFGAVQGAIPKLGQRQDGGYIPQTGYYRLHKGEEVIPSGKGAGSINVNVSGMGNDKLKRMIEATCEQYFRTQYTNY